MTAATKTLHHHRGSEQINHLVSAGLARRHRKTFALHLGISAGVCFAIGWLALIVVTIIWKGLGALTTYGVQVPLSAVQLEETRQVTSQRKRVSECRGQLREGLYSLIGDGLSRQERRAVRSLLSFSEECQMLVALGGEEGTITAVNDGAVEYSALLGSDASLFLANDEIVVGEQLGAGSITLASPAADGQVLLRLSGAAATTIEQITNVARNNTASLAGIGPVLLIGESAVLSMDPLLGAQDKPAAVLFGVVDQSIGKQQWQPVALERPDEERTLSPLATALLLKIKLEGLIETRFDTNLFTQSASRYAEKAGILSALLGSALTLLVTFCFSFPMGVGAGIYLEEIAKKGRFTNFLEVSINNMAAVPSIVFGLLGLAVLINFMGMPRSAPVVGGLVLGLMVMPNIIVATRAALKAVPQSIRDAALALGASHLQAVFHQALPSAMPGIMTGAIIAMARALGETAPLLMIGMVAFIASTPTDFTSPATVLPVQIYLWAGSPEPAFAARSSAAIVVLLLFLITMNLCAVLVRNKFQVKR